AFSFTSSSVFLPLFFFNAPAPTEIYTLSLHDALPICRRLRPQGFLPARSGPPLRRADRLAHEVRRRGVQPAQSRENAEAAEGGRSEEHTSELQSLAYLVCRLLLEKKK